jgi:hypothetical protein
VVNRFLGFDAYEWSVMLVGSALLALATWLMYVMCVSAFRRSPRRENAPIDSTCTELTHLGGAACGSDASPRHSD